MSAKKSTPRVRKLYMRLGELERQFRSLVRDEFTLEISGRLSPFLTSWSREKTQHCDELNRLSSQIKSLRRKLGETGPGPTNETVACFVDAFDNLGTKQTFGDRVSLAKRALERLDENLH